MNLLSLMNGLIEIGEKDKGLLANLEISGISLNSTQTNVGDLFIAVAGANHHGLRYAEAAIVHGAVAILFDPAEDGIELAKTILQVPILAVENLSSVLGGLAAKFFGHPSNQLAVIGITGTNGKTSCSHFLGQILDNSSVIGTLGWGEWGHLNATLNTTPDALTVQKILAQFVSEHKQAVAMEVSSHGLDQGRVNGVEFSGAVFTNLTRDHLDYHPSMADYLATKLKLFKLPGVKFAVVNLDDDSSEQVIAAIPFGVELWAVSAQGKHLTAKSGNLLAAKNIGHSPHGLEFDVTWQGECQRIKTPLFGDFNIENILCVLAVALARGMGMGVVASKLQRIKPVPGRMDSCDSNDENIRVFVDYAHTPDALDRVLASVRQHCRNSLWVVFGCGGNRDAGKRPLMGKVAGRWADRIIIADDNPRHEDNQAIAKSVLEGCPIEKAILIQDRKQAIEYAINEARENDCVVIAGKGHEEYQEIKGVRYPFSDKLIAETALKNRIAA